MARAATVCRLAGRSQRAGPRGGVMSRLYDAAVVGGGPAGSASAALLASRGLDVVVLDRARFPRDKPCGEFLTPGAVDILQEMGAWPSVLTAGAAPIAEIEISGRIRSVR